MGRGLAVNPVDSTFIETFAGVGGIRLAMERAGHRCIWANEINRQAAAVYRWNFNDETLVEGDIKKIKSEAIPDGFDCLVGGFSCQPFSISGKKQGFKDARGTDFFELARILADKRPRRFLFENVKNLLGHEQGQTIQQIARVLTDLGYNVCWTLLNGAKYGLPQYRTRVVIMGDSRREPSLQALLQPESDGLYTQVDKSKVATCLDASYWKGWLDNGQRTFLEYPDGRIRGFTPLECERLQGLPDNWTRYGLTADGQKIEIKDTPRIIMCGNSVPVPAIEDAARRLYAPARKGGLFL